MQERGGAVPRLCVSGAERATFNDFEGAVSFSFFLMKHHETMHFKGVSWPFKPVTALIRPRERFITTLKCMAGALLCKLRAESAQSRHASTACDV